MTRNMFKRLMPSLLMIAIFGVTQLVAQSTVTGGINGSVTDPQGRVVPNAAVTVTNIGTNAVVTVNASSEGGYRVSNLQPGTYRVETTVSGFAPARADNVVVEVGVITNVDIPLTLGTATAEVEVKAEAPVINTNDSTNSRNINQTSINELPINGRRASSFVLGTPGVTPDGGFGLVSFRGISGLLNNSTVDGGDDNQAFFSEARGRTRISSSISQDAVREFQVNTSNYSAEFGRAAGGVVNTVTKSGTNEFHGSAFYFFRDNEYGARNPLIFPGPGNLTGKPKDVRHQYGGSIGGPIAQDRLFFFFSFDQQKRDFPGVAQPGNASFLNPITVPGLTPAQVTAGIAYLQNLTGVVPRRGDQTLILPKIDWVINDKHTFTAVYNRLRWNSPAGVQTAATVQRGRTSFGSDIVQLDSYNFRLNSVLSSRIINEARFQYSRDLEQQIADTPDASEPRTGGGFPPSSAIGGGGGITIGKPNFLNRNAFPDEKRWQFADSVTLSRGNQTIKFGADINHVSDVLASLFTESGAYVYSSLSNFLLDFNIPSSKAYTNFTQGFGPLKFQFVTRDFNFFYQHDIRVDSNLTLNFGLRYEYQQKPAPQLPNPLEARTTVFPADKDNFGPRIGFAYSFGANSENVIRGGYGMFYGRITNSAISNAITNTGLAAGQRTFFTLPNATSPLYPNVLPSFPTGGTAFGGDIIVFSPGIENPRIHQLDAIYERQIGRNTAISFTGMISHGQYLPYFIDTNLSPPTATTTFAFNGGPLGGTTFVAPRFTGPRPNTNFGRITEISSVVSSDYYGFVAQLNRRMTNGIQFQTSYTYSSAEDNGQNSQTFTTANSPLNPFDLGLELGRSNFDVPHRFVASVIFAPTTLFRVGTGSRAGKILLGGWSVAPIVTASSGFTYSGTTTGSIAGLTSSGVLGAGGSTRIPSLAPNTFRSPKIFNVDLRLSKRFRFTETMNLEFLAEAFNLFNRFHSTGINSTMYTLSGTTFNFSPTFGSVTAAGNSNIRERQVQFAVRFQF